MANSAKNKKEQIQEFLSQNISNPKKSGEEADKLLYQKSMTGQQFNSHEISKANPLRQTPYAEIAKNISVAQEKAHFIAQTETQREYTKKRGDVSYNHVKISDKELWHNDRRSKANFPGKHESETKESYQRYPIVQSQFEYPNLYEHHFAIGNPKMKIEGKTAYGREYERPDCEGAIGQPMNDLIPNNEIKLPNTYKNGVKTKYGEEYERFDLKIYKGNPIRSLKWWITIILMLIIGLGLGIFQGDPIMTKIFLALLNCTFRNCYFN